MDNRVYAMTKGQPSPTTERDWDSEIAPGGTQIPPFNPISLALAAGANFVARGFAGRPDELAELILEGMRWPGFSFIEVLSPCVVFRPEEREWKRAVRPSQAISVDRSAALNVALTDDGLSLGLLFKGTPRVDAPRDSARTSIAVLEQQFSV
jgi:2-oxoglutarate ferredoxin oxidoreductase subunit beta